MNHLNDYSSRFGEKEIPDFSLKYQEKDIESEPEELNTEKSIEQSTASFLGHGLSAVAKIPDAIRNLAYEAGDEAKRLRNYMSEKLGTSFEPNFIENDSIKNFEESIKAPFRFLNDYIPTSEQVTDFVNNIGGGYFKPRGDLQKLANDMGEDIVLSTINRSPKNFIQNFLIPVGANTIKKGAELFGADPNTQEILKMVSWIGSDLAYISDPRAMLRDRFSQTRRMTNPNDLMNVNPRDMRFLDQLERDMRSGGTRPSTGAALTKIEELRDAMASGQVSPRQILDTYRANNELLSNFGAFNVEGAGRPEHVYRLNQVQQLTRNMLNRYGRNQNPRFLESFNENNLAWAALQQSDNVARFVKKNYTKPFVSEAARELFGKAGGKGIALATGLTALERLQSFMRRLQNPVLRRYYGDVLGNSIQRNAATMIKSLDKLNFTAKNEE